MAKYLCVTSLSPSLDSDLFSISHRLSVVGLQPSFSPSTGCVVLLRGDWAIFCHSGSGRVGRVWSAREKSLGILRRGWELNPGHREDRHWAIPLSYHGWRIQITTSIVNHREPTLWDKPRIVILKTSQSPSDIICVIGDLILPTCLMSL